MTDFRTGSRYGTDDTSNPASDSSAKNSGSSSIEWSHVAFALVVYCIAYVVCWSIVTLLLEKLGKRL